MQTVVAGPEVGREVTAEFLEEWVPVGDFAERFPNLFVSENAVRWAIRKRKENGLEAAGAVRKTFGRWMLHPDRVARAFEADVAKTTELAAAG